LQQVFILWIIKYKHVFKVAVTYWI